ncbi:MAG: 3-ketoacyl-CoA thiolase [candidate division Zixibacteria bacterium SM23_73_2]|nr:MAG: 3-ketoacyl-CoA thiolase [candidate division Zixibacteria bacterium SM23_73_2]
MKRPKKKVYATCGFNTISLGTGRREFHPKKPRPGLEYYIQEAGKGVIAQMNDPENIDEGVIGNFMAARFNKQGNLAALIPTIHPSLEFKPHTRVEGACGSGGLALLTSVKSIASELSDVVLTIGVEVQNTYKAIYGADILGGAGHYLSQRKNGHAYFFPGQFSDRAGACYDKFGYEHMRKGMACWYKQAVENARRNPKAQEYHNTAEDLFALGMTPPNPKVFVDHLNVYDCSKVSDGASALLFCSEEGLKKIGIDKKDAIEVVGFGIAVADVTKLPEDLTIMDTTKKAVEKAYNMSGLGPQDIGVLELHDCFTIGGILALEATGFCKYGEASGFVQDGKTNFNSEISTNSTGGLIGFGHYTGGTGVRQAADCVHQLTEKAGNCQVKLNPDKPYALMISMGGNDRTVTAMIFRRAE